MFAICIFDKIIKSSIKANDSSNFRSQLAPNRMTEYELLVKESPGSTVSAMATIMFISK